MGRPSDHLLAHTGPTAELRPLASHFSEQHARLRATEAETLTSQDRGSVVSLSWRSGRPWLAGTPAVPPLVGKLPWGCPSSLPWAPLPCPSVSAENHPRFWAPPLPNAGHLTGNSLLPPFRGWSPPAQGSGLHLLRVQEEGPQAL